MNIGERIAFTRVDDDIFRKRRKRERLDQEIAQLEGRREHILNTICERYPKVYRVCQKRSAGWHNGVFVYKCNDAGGRHRCFTRKEVAEQHCAKRNDEPYMDGFPSMVEEVPAEQELTVQTLQELDVVDVNELLTDF
jgi:hypothetical protein